MDTSSHNKPMNTRIERIQFEHLREALGIGIPQPRISWIVQTDHPNWEQLAYEIESFSASGEKLEQSGRINSPNSVLVPWPFSPLTSRQRVGVRVRVWGKDGEVSDWSDLAWVEAALLSPEEWKAQFIRPGWDEDATQPRPGPLMRKEFSLPQKVRQAHLYITALGVYEASLNGTIIGDQVMPPGWTSYHHRLRYQIYDVTELLHEGTNAIGVMLGDGWFRGRLGFGGGRVNIYGDHVALLAQLEADLENGEKVWVITDETWKATRGPILYNNIYDGEIYDARLEPKGWNEPGFNDRDWLGVVKADWDYQTLFAPLEPPVRRVETLEPKEIFLSPSGKTLVDFGQNLVGRLQITVRGAAGTTITLRHAEVLENGELATRPLRYAKATDQYILKGDGIETWEPRFTFHGFRYAEVTGWPGDLRSEDIRAVVCHSDMERTGWFECSDPLINRLHENVVWSMRGNFFYIPTDCPQRDERLGWTGDIQVFSPTASFLYDAAGFLTSWLADLAAEQKETGVVPFVVPTIMEHPTPPAAAWGDAAVIIPWVLYQRFGDEKILSDQFESMRAWVDLIEKTAGESRLWDKGFQFGDWLDPAAPPDKPGDARTPGFIVATAYFARSSEIVGQAAKVLGRKEEEKYYLNLSDEVRKAFNWEYVTPSGRVLSDSATAYALALQFALLPHEAQRRRAGARLTELVRSSGYRISTGFVGTPLICDALCTYGDPEAAFRLITQRECPSWLYPVTMGATTIWERWDSMLPDGRVNPGEMTSFNHYALGAVADWLHRAVAGLAPAEPGYRRIEVHPILKGSLKHASARHLTPYGMASTSWKLDGETLTVEVEVPPNTRARIMLPGKEEAPLEVGSGKYSWKYPFTPQTPPYKPISLDSTVGDLIDDPEAFSTVLQVLRSHGTELADHLLSREDIKLRDAVGFMPQAKSILEDLQKALASLHR